MIYDERHKSFDKKEIKTLFNEIVLEESIKKEDLEEIETVRTAYKDSLNVCILSFISWIITFGLIFVSGLFLLKMNNIINSYNTLMIFMCFLYFVLFLCVGIYMIRKYLINRKFSNMFTINLYGHVFLFLSLGALALGIFSFIVSIDSCAYCFGIGFIFTLPIAMMILSLYIKTNKKAR